MEVSIQAVSPLFGVHTVRWLASQAGGGGGVAGAGAAGFGAAAAGAAAGAGVCARALSKAARFTEKRMPKTKPASASRDGFLHASQAEVRPALSDGINFISLLLLISVEH